MDISALTAAIEATKQAGQMAAALYELKLDTDTQARLNALARQLTEVHERLLAASQSQMALHCRCEQMKKEIAEMTQFEMDKPNYRAIELGPDAWVIARKDEQGGEPFIKFCAHCFENAQKSVLQFHGYQRNCRVLRCHRCGAEVLIADDTGSVAVAGQRIDWSGY